jgi:hypothetical protein
MSSSARDDEPQPHTTTREPVDLLIKQTVRQLPAQVTAFARGRHLSDLLKAVVITGSPRPRHLGCFTLKQQVGSDRTDRSTAALEAEVATLNALRQRDVAALDTDRTSPSLS